MGQVLRYVLPTAGLLAGACLVPPSFEGYEPAGAPADAASDAGPEGGDGGGDVEAGALPGFGEPCLDDGRCADGLECASKWGLSDVVVMSGQRRWTCVAPCAKEGELCTPGSGDIVGLCLDTLTQKGPACVRVCDATTASSGCPDGFSCWQFAAGGGFGLCFDGCTSDADCKLHPLLKKCGLDRVCNISPPPADPTLACTLTSTCFCYPVATSGGTCRIACEKDSDCPVHTPSGRKMVCPMATGVMPTYASCAVPCDSPGSDSVCEAMGLTCSAQQPWNGSYVCLDS